VVYENAQLPIAEGGAEAFQQAMIEGLEVIRAAPGCRDAVLAAGVEEPATYLLLVSWDDVEAHTAFGASASGDAFRGIVGPHLGGKPAVLHFTPVS
jgi:heme-degrading monooxygenase HmoA